MGGYGGLIASTMAQTADEDVARKRQRKDILSDQDHVLKRDLYLKDLDSYRDQIRALKDNPQYADQVQKLKDLAAQREYDLHQLYDPIKAPGKLQQDWNYLRERIHGIKQPPAAVTSQTPAVTLNSPAAPISSPELPAYDQTTPRLPSQGGSVTTQEPGLAAMTSPGMQSTISLPAGPPVTVTKAPLAWKDRGSYQSPGELKKIAASRQKAQEEAGLLAAGAGLSPEQEATSQAQKEDALLQSRLQAIESNKLLTPDEKEDQRARILGGSQKPVPKPFKLPNGLIQYFDVTRPDLIPEGATAVVGTASGATAEELREYAEDTDPKKGPFPQWLATKRAQGTASAKPQSKDDRYIAINQKRALGQSISPDDQAFINSYDLWTRKTKIDPGVARAAAFGAMRYVPVIDLNNPENVVLMRAGDAAKAGASTPASIGFKTDQAITRYMTSGAGGTNINYFNTATDHLRILAEAGQALNNGDTQLFNRVANQFAMATGDPAPSNFETVKAAVAGELSKTFKGTGATDSEIADINQTINQAQSPQQITGAITYYQRLMGSKVQALKSQYEAAKSGKPNFPDGTPPRGKGSRSLAAAMALTINQGKTADEVQKHLESLGYTVTKP